jgi:hypothetical protein
VRAKRGVKGEKKSKSKSGVGGVFAVMEELSCSPKERERGVGDDAGGFCWVCRRWCRRRKTFRNPSSTMTRP